MGSPPSAAAELAYVHKRGRAGETERNYTHCVVGSQPLDVIQSHIDAHHAQDQLVLEAEAEVCSGLSSIRKGSPSQLRTSMTSSCSHKWPPVRSAASCPSSISDPLRACPTLPGLTFFSPGPSCVRLKTGRVPVTTIPQPLKGEEKYGSDSCGQPCPYLSVPERGALQGQATPLSHLFGFTTIRGPSGT